MKNKSLRRTQRRGGKSGKLIPAGTDSISYLFVCLCLRWAVEHLWCVFAKSFLTDTFQHETLSAADEDGVYNGVITQVEMAQFGWNVIKEISQQLNCCASPPSTWLWCCLYFARLGPLSTMSGDIFCHTFCYIMWMSHSFHIFPIKSRKADAASKTGDYMSGEEGSCAIWRECNQRILAKYDQM